VQRRLDLLCTQGDLMKFRVVINGRIKGVNHRFAGGNGMPEVYEAKSSKEILLLRSCPYADEIIELQDMDWDTLRKMAKGVYKVGMTRDELVAAVKKSKVNGDTG
jgi:hypothetical protein